MAKRRLFLAVELPTNILDALERLQDELRRAFPAARMANPAGMHLTLKFIGYTETGQIPVIAEAARQAAGSATPFRLFVSGLGGFPSITKPRVIWACVTDGGRSTDLNERLNTVLTDLGVVSESRPYQPHITLARINRPSFTPVEATMQAAAQSEDLGETVADKLILFESHLKAGGAEYEVLDTFAFCLDTNTCL